MATDLAIMWGEELWQNVTAEALRQNVSQYEFMERRATPQQRIEALARVSDQMAANFGTWQTPWGDINRFQRLTADIVHPFDDAGPSIPVPFTAGRWSSLASLGHGPTTV